MKEKFENAEIEIIRFEKEDLIATSGNDDTSGDQIGEGEEDLD